MPIKKCVCLMVLLSATESFAGPTQAKTCTYEVAKGSVVVGWTAFKTTKKVGVAGHFKQVEVKGGGKGQTLASAVHGLEVAVDKLQVDTGNPARDKTLTDYFFAKLASPISGSVKSLSETGHSLVVSLTLNGQSHDVELHYVMEGDLAFTATGKIDILDFGGAAALQALNAKCSDLHKGPDGVSKTWSDADLSIRGTMTKTCS